MLLSGPTAAADTGQLSLLAAAERALAHYPSLAAAAARPASLPVPSRASAR